MLEAENEESEAAAMFELFTDSACNLSPALSAERGITVLPLHCMLGEREIDESFDPAAFYGSLRRGEVSHTSLVNVAIFLEAFRAALERGHDVVYMGLSHALSGTFHAAEIAAEELRQEFPERRVELADSLGSSLGEGLPVLRAAALRDAGADAREAGRELRDAAAHMIQLLTVSDLKYLQRTGRLSGTAAMIGGALNVKAVLTGNSRGECVVTGRARGTRKVLEGMAERWKEQCIDPAGEIGITHGDNESDALRLLAMLRERGFAGECRIELCDFITGSHVGPDAVALFFYGDRREE